jgi:uracil-DNA glycosylase family 4
MTLDIQIQPQGKKGAKIAFCGEAPGAEEMAYRPTPRPFVGPAGRELNNELQRAGIRREDTFITNIVRYKLPRNDFSVMYLDKSCTKPTLELQEWWAYLEQELKGVNPNVIVPLGRFALHAITGLQGIGKWRGSIVPSKWGAKCVPTYHPSGIIQNWEARPLAILDLRKAKRESLHPKIILPPENFILRPTIEQALAYIEKCRQVGIVSVDIETFRYYQILCIGLSCAKTTAICIPFYENNQPYWQNGDYQEITGELKDLLMDSKVKKVGQNFQYDMSWLQRKGFPVDNLWFDTMVAHHAAWSEMPKDLGTLASIYTDRPFWKDENKDWKRIRDYKKLWHYNCLDACSVFEMIEPLQSEIALTGTRKQFEFEMELVPIFVDMTMRGIKFDRKKQGEQKKVVEDMIVEKLVDLNKYIPDTWVCKKCKGVGTIGKKKVKECPACKGLVKWINYRSPAQLKELIYTHLKLPKSAFGKKLSTDEDALLKLQAKTHHPVLQIILDLRELEELHEMLCMKCDSDGRIRTTLACTTETGRLASSGSPWGTGRNLQNIHRKTKVPIRDLFVADEGFTMLGPDYSQAEVRVMAYESGDVRLIQVFEEGRDIHTENAKAIFEKEVINNDERQLGKRIGHACDYGISPRGIVDAVLRELGPNYAILEKEARRFQEAYFAHYPGLRAFHERIMKDILANRTVWNCFGRKRVYLGRPSGKSLKELVAHIPQSTVADLTETAFKRISRNEALLAHKVQSLLQVHDQLLLQCPMEHVEFVIPIVKDCMSLSLKAYYTGLEYTIPVDMKQGRSWGELK